MEKKTVANTAIARRAALKRIALAAAGLTTGAVLVPQKALAGYGVSGDYLDSKGYGVSGDYVASNHYQVSGDYLDSNATYTNSYNNSYSNYSNSYDNAYSNSYTNYSNNYSNYSNRGYSVSGDYVDSK